MKRDIVARFARPAGAGRRVMGGFDPRDLIDPAIGDELNERSRLKAGNPGF